MNYKQILFVIFFMCAFYLLSNEKKDTDISSQTKTTATKTKKEINFTYLRTKTYSCGGVSSTVKEYLHNRTGMEFILVPSGTFMMGSNNKDDEKPVHSVSLDSFLISKTEVTQGIWQKIMISTPWQKRDNVKIGVNYPVTHVSWNDIKVFCYKTGLQLPTEAQWEYSCRAGTTTEYYWGTDIDGDYTWYKHNTHSMGEKYAHIVATKKPNAFGLYDMSGNVNEWCADWYANSYSNNTVRNPVGPSRGFGRVIRGGGWAGEALYHRSTVRSWISPSAGYSDLGFRVVCSSQNLSEKQ